MLIRSFFHKKMAKVGMKITYSPISVEKCTEWQNLTILRSISYCTSLTNMTSCRNLFDGIRRNIALRGSRGAVRPVSILILVLEGVMHLERV